MATRVVLLALLLSSVLAFSNTVPFVAWSSQRYPRTMYSHAKSLELRPTLVQMYSTISLLARAPSTMYY